MTLFAKKDLPGNFVSGLKGVKFMESSSTKRGNRERGETFSLKKVVDGANESAREKVLLRRGGVGEEGESRAAP